MNLFRWFRRPSKSPRGIHFGEDDARWAETRFDVERRPFAAYVARLLCEQLGLKLSELEPAKTFGTDLHVDFAEWVEVLLALKADLGLEEPDPGCARPVDTVADLVEYLHTCLRLSEGSSAKPS